MRIHVERTLFIIAVLHGENDQIDISPVLRLHFELNGIIPVPEGFCGEAKYVCSIEKEGVSADIQVSGDVRWSDFVFSEFPDAFRRFLGEKQKRKSRRQNGKSCFQIHCRSFFYFLQI